MHMKPLAEKLRKDIKRAAREQGINPFKQAFKPSDLKLKASNYGSFADFCDPKEALSGRWQSEVILKVAERTRRGRPKRYLLIDSE